MVRAALLDRVSATQQTLVVLDQTAAQEPSLVEAEVRRRL